MAAPVDTSRVVCVAWAVPIAALACLVALCSTTSANELTQARRLAAKYSAQVEVRLPDDSRVDLLSDTHAIEVDWAPKWAEAVGQAIHYSLLADRKPAVILLLRDPATEWRHLVRAAQVCGRLGIVLYVEPVRERIATP